MDSLYNTIVEAVIFSADEPVTSKLVIEAIKAIDGQDVEVTEEDIESCVDLLNNGYDEKNLSFKITRVAGGYVFGTKPEYAKYVGYLSTEKSKRRLSPAALETLAIIAYKQPLTKPEIEAIRGVNSDYIMNMLLEKSLITIKGRAERIGRPLLYGTTDEFLKYFGLFKISDLPKPREIEEIMQDEDFQEQKRKLFMSDLEESIEKEASTKENEPVAESITASILDEISDETIIVDEDVDEDTTE